jgi:hypothetical protein
MFASARAVGLRDNYERVDIYRSGVRVGTLQARISLHSNATVGRDQNSLPGDSSPGSYVMPVPLSTDIEQGDEVWADACRYRVVSLEQFPGQIQVMLTYIQ